MLRPFRLTALVALSWSLTAVSPAANADEAADDYLRKLIAGYKRAGERANGVQLTAKVEGGRKESAGAVLIHWSVDYTGPRQPLTILKPSVTAHAAFGQTTALFFLIAADGREYAVTFQPEPYPGIFFPAKEDFVTVKPGQSGAGTIAVPVADIRAAARKRWPKQFGEVPPRAVYAQLRHQPTARGENHSLDAWTGTLATELIPVPLEEVYPK